VPSTRIYEYRHILCSAAVLVLVIDSASTAEAVEHE
jgi:hypothetical protein